ncbi:MAG: hypothetical protein U0744_13320 [Gemmataceae bacterium]
MKRIGLQALAAAMTVLLVLPQGWCCLVPRMLPKAKEAEPACCCCHVQTDAPKPDQESKPSEPTDPFACCCEPREATPDQPVAFDLHSLPIAMLPTSERTTSDLSFAWASLDRILDTSDPPLHILLCVWRC